MEVEQAEIYYGKMFTEIFGLRAFPNSDSSLLLCTKDR